MLTQESGSSTWVKEASPLPLAFAQTREDPILDRLVVEKLGGGSRIAMIASGGCTAAYLASLPGIASIDLVDPNPAQIALSRLKLHLLAHEEGPTRLELLGHAGTSVARKAGLAKQFRALNLAEDSLGPWELVTTLGPDHAGRYEACFQALAKELEPFREELANLLAQPDPVFRQSTLQSDSPLGIVLDEALDKVMSLPNLMALFGEGATRNPVDPFSRHFARRIRIAVTQFPASSNTFLWQMLTGGYPQDNSAEWFKVARPEKRPELSFHREFMDDFLAKSQRETFDLIHLSNILDWLTPAEGKRTLELAHRTLKPGGLVFIRQLNSSLDIPRLGEEFDWQLAESDRLLSQDRSFFYRSLHLGLKPCG